MRALVTYGANTSPDGLTSGVRTFFRNSSTKRLGDELGADYTRLSSTPEHLPVVIEKIRQMWLTEPTFTADELASITSPTAIVDGTREELISLDHVETIAKAIPGAELTWIPQASHYAPDWTPSAFNKVVLDFLKDK